MKKRLIYCDRCRRKVMPCDDKDWHEGKEHIFAVDPDICEPSEGDLEIELSVVSRRRIGGDAADLCLDCTKNLLKEALGCSTEKPLSAGTP